MQYIDPTKRAGWDDLYEDCFEGINQIIEDNLKQVHNEEVINNIFPKMTLALDKAIEKMKGLPGDEEKKKPWFEKADRLKEFLESVDTMNKKVIGINMVDQFLRATY